MRRIFPNGVTGKKCRAFFPARGVKTPIGWGLGEIPKPEEKKK